MDDLDKTSWIDSLFAPGDKTLKKILGFGDFGNLRPAVNIGALCCQGKVTALLFFFPFFFSFPLLVTRPVDGKLCLGPAPSASQLCNLPCPSECVVSAWAAWGPCLHENCQDRQGRRGNGCSYTSLAALGDLKRVMEYYDKIAKAVVSNSTSGA